MRTIDPELWNKKFKKQLKAESLSKNGYCEDIESRLRGSFNDMLHEYWKHCTAPVLRYIRNIDGNKSSRYFYAILILGLMAWGTSVTLYVNWEFQNRPPLEINVRGTTRNAKIAFPAVAICSNTIITYRALDTYTDYFSKITENFTYNKIKIKIDLKMFVNLITLFWPKPDMEFMSFIHEKYRNFNVTNLMFDFSPKCSEILKRCSWRGYKIQCTSLFAERPTPLGFCCVFNSRYHPADLKNRPHTLNIVGEHYGLVVVISENPDEAAVTRRPIDGFDVLIFDGTQYPLLESGVVRLLPVSRNESVYFPLQTHVQTPSKSLHEYSENWRRCHLRQMYGSWNKDSSYPWCLTECRKRTIAALCNCLPFTLIPNANDTTCTPEHLICLAKHREKFLYYYPGKDADFKSLTKERQDSQQCQHCMPDCTRDWYTTVPFRIKHYFSKKFWTNKFSSGVSFVNKTVLRFYYDSIYHEVYDVDINVSELEAFAKMSSSSRMFTGMSFITASELLFFFIIRWVYNFLWRKNSSRHNQDS